MFSFLLVNRTYFEGFSNEWWYVFVDRKTQCWRPLLHNKSSNTDQRSRLNACRHVFGKV